MKLVKSAAVLMAFVAPFAANASDLPSKAKAPAAPSANTYYLFDGAYIGGNIGAGFTNTNTFSPENDFDGTTYEDTDIGSYSGNGVIGGIQVGYDTRYGDYVFGVQGMFDLASIDSSTIWPDDPTEVLEAKLRSFSTITARAGVLLQPTLLAYVKGGFAMAKFDYTDDDSDYIFTGGASESRTGWIVGAGLEYVIAQNWSAFIEYNHADFGTKATTLTYDINNGERSVEFSYDYTHKVDALLFGVNYRF